MTIGDIIEWIAGALLVTAAWVSPGGEPAGLATAGVFVFYEAQCLAGSPLTLRLHKRSKDIS